MSIWTPWATEIHLINIVCCREVAMVENVAISLVGRSRGCCDIAISLCVDGAQLKPSCRRTKDEVGSAFDIAVFE